MRGFNFSAKGGFGAMLANTQGHQINEYTKRVLVHTTRGDATDKAATDLIERAIKKVGIIRKFETYREKDKEVIFQDSSNGKDSSKIWEVVVNKDGMVGPWALASVSY
ncbi:MAG: hypothetical protein ACRCTP_03620 [Aeromonas popoffii]|uniref:hypothetical protein n=1 Tax=Aeromonas popoffii TaxID=70856 RepID=UPI003F3F5390